MWFLIFTLLFNIISTFPTATSCSEQKKKKKVEVTLLTLLDAWLTSSYETLQTHAFATSPPTAQKQLWWRAASGVVFLFQSQLACLHRSRWHCAVGPPSWPYWCEFSVLLHRYLDNSLMSCLCGFVNFCVASGRFEWTNQSFEDKVVVPECSF